MLGAGLINPAGVSVLQDGNQQESTRVWYVNRLVFAGVSYLRSKKSSHREQEIDSGFPCLTKRLTNLACDTIVCEVVMEVIAQ